jgi:hypothetical protein
MKSYEIQWTNALATGKNRYVLRRERYQGSSKFMRKVEESLVAGYRRSIECRERLLCYAQATCRIGARYGAVDLLLSVRFFGGCRSALEVRGCGAMEVEETGHAGSAVSLD